MRRGAIIERGEGNGDTACPPSAPLPLGCFANKARRAATRTPSLLEGTPWIL
eukprot:CAMPEP_0171242110 /NCGR_PEP_ID=MMETSP0790-20130122/45487_1 /TAXON_ID=2925 /ORGANISM="Alexandrium catenella, Strain OF101" /LENGTH=51 /DNA_ID=CAMNT_0011708831 /DNA_START=84 /DNA_END=236 /DNA_ORIENTATION=-